ncbi:hypothetical protein FA95DRAFT_1103106 [Auriscalpium vulgare]|uniref:Uncharacterized protein n=1 Tax=Auriscalpium vulgare TaxID=40419 RepID=A0ACB8R4P6_9AGAM|nr:hypothetical protein FA95DRAFT_1103106 [Auriscalpium vulgare]
MTRTDAHGVPIEPFPRNTYLLPTYGAYVVFTLNPAATLEALEDPVATEQAAALKPKKYHECTCHILSNSLPVVSDTDHTDETMCVPIAPATHPGGRKALSPTPPLPWVGLYHHTLDEIDLRVTTDLSPSVDHSLSPMISMRDVIDMMEAMAEDVQRQSQLRAATQPISSSSPLTSPLAREDDGGLNEELDDRASYGCSFDDSDLSESDASSDDLDWIREALGDPFDVQENPAKQFMPVVHFDVDLSSVVEFTDAKYFFEEIAALERYVQVPNIHSISDTSATEFVLNLSSGVASASKNTWPGSASVTRQRPNTIKRVSVSVRGP